MGTYTPPLPPQNYVHLQGPVVDAPWLNAIDNILQGNVPSSGVYNPTFQSGQVQVVGPDGNLISYGDLIFGLQIPNPSGASGVALLLGGAGKSRACLLTDAQIPTIDGIELLINSGAAASGTSHNGGALRLIGGAADAGVAGPAVLQGGSALSGAGGDVSIQGGNSTSGAAGNVYIIAGTTGTAGGNVKIYSTNLNNVAGDISFWLGQPDIPHSVPLWTMSHTGALFPGNQGAGTAGLDVLVSGGNLASPTWGQPGLSGVVSLTLSGATSGTPSANFAYHVFAGHVLLSCSSLLTAAATGPNDIILSTLPSFLWPSTPKLVMCGGLFNSSSGGYFGQATVGTTGGITISLAIPTNGGTSLGVLPNNWGANPGASKGISAGWTLMYPL